MGQAKGLVELGDFRELSDEPLQVGEGAADVAAVRAPGRLLEEPLSLVEVPALRRPELHHEDLGCAAGLLRYRLDPGRDERPQEPIIVGDDLVQLLLVPARGGAGLVEGRLVVWQQAGEFGQNVGVSRLAREERDGWVRRHGSLLAPEGPLLAGACHWRGAGARDFGLGVHVVAGNCGDRMNSPS